MMAFVSLSDETGQADMAVMPRLYQKKADILVRGMYIRFNVKIEEGKSFLANEIQEVRKKPYDKNTNC
jgi:DNA polymerase-3 subunit alpha